MTPDNNPSTNKAVREALEFYADDFNYRRSPKLKKKPYWVLFDNGYKAREALAILDAEVTAGVGGDYKPELYNADLDRLEFQTEDCTVVVMPVTGGPFSVLRKSGSDDVVGLMIDNPLAYAKKLSAPAEPETRKVTVSQPTPEFIEALGQAKMSPEHDHLNALMEPEAEGDAGANALEDFLYARQENENIEFMENTTIKMIIEMLGGKYE
jgi:hypothetical protein